MIGVNQSLVNQIFVSREDNSSKEHRQRGIDDEVINRKFRV